VLLWQPFRHRPISPRRSRAAAIAHDRRLGLPDHDQHAALWLRDLLPVFFIKQGLTIATSFRYSLVMSYKLWNQSKLSTGIILNHGIRDIRSLTAREPPRY
jgi:hypothetical protein